MRPGIAALLVALSAACGPDFDTTPPTIEEGPTASVVRDTTATIAWLTDERANAVVEYGTTEAYGQAEIDNLYLESHVITLRNLLPETTYHLRVASYDLFGNGPSRSGDLVITTLPPLPPPDLVITEVMTEAVDQDVGEFVEIKNDGFDTVDLTGFAVADGDGDDTLQSFDGGATELEPGAYALIVDAEYVPDTYDLPDGTVLVTTGDTTIGNGLSKDDPISLFAPGEAVAVTTYGTPDDATDNLPLSSATTGKSVERRVVADPDEPGNWCVSEDPGGSTPGRDNSGCE